MSTDHPLLTEHPDIRAAADEFAQTVAAGEAYKAKIAAAKAEYEREQKAALDRGETHSPRLEVIPDAAIRSHLATREKVAEERYQQIRRRSAREVLGRLEAREQEVLALALRSKPNQLGELVDEIAQLRHSRAQMVRFVPRSTSSALPAPGFHADPVPDTPLTAGALVDAALANRTLIGRSREVEPGEGERVFPDALSRRPTAPVGV